MAINAMSNPAHEFPGVSGSNNQKPWEAFYSSSLRTISPAIAAINMPKYTPEPRSRTSGIHRYGSRSENEPNAGKPVSSGPRSYFPVDGGIVS